MRGPLRLIPVAIVAGCSSGTGPESYQAEPVLVLMLTAGEPSHRLTATWSVPVDSVDVLSGAERPITAADLVIRIDGPAGVTALPRPVADSPGVYRLDLMVTPETQYRLGGTVAGRPVSGATTVPGPISFVVPANGLIALDQATLQDVRYHVRSRGAAKVVLRNPRFPEFPAAVGDTIGVWRFPTAFFDTDTTRLMVHAEDAAAAGYLDRSYWVTNLTGAVGVLGSRVAASLLVVRQ